MEPGALRISDTRHEGAVRASSPEEDEPASPVDALLRGDLLLLVFTLLAPRDLAAASRVCHAWREAAVDDRVWLRLVRRRWWLPAAAPRPPGRGQAPAPRGGWARAFREAHATHRLPSAGRFVGPRTHA
jgi:hypothetical protein